MNSESIEAGPGIAPSARSRSSIVESVPAPGVPALRLEYFPDGRGPVPPLLTSLEVVELLRLDRVTRDGHEARREPADALKSLDHLVRHGKLIPRQFSKCRTFARDDVLALIDGADLRTSEPKAIGSDDPKRGDI